MRACFLVAGVEAAVRFAKVMHRTPLCRLPVTLPFKTSTLIPVALASLVIAAGTSLAKS